MRPFTRAAAVFAVFIVVLSHVGRLFELTLDRSGRARGDTRVMLLVDVSGSMGGEKLQRAREALRSVAASLPGETVVGLRSFSTDTRLLAPPVVGGKAGVDGAARTLDLGGGTNIGAGLTAVGEDIARAGNGGPWKIVLVSDGEGNDVDADMLAARALAARFPDVTCDAIGIEMNAVGEAELTRITSLLRGRCWLVGRNQLQATLHQAVSLAGFRTTSGGADLRITVLAVMLFAFLVSGALRLRLQVSEAVFSATLSAAAGTAAYVATQVLLPSGGTALGWLALVQNVACFTLVGGLLGVVLAMVEGIYLNEPRKAFEQVALSLPVGIFGGAIAGLFGQALFALLGQWSWWVLRYGARAAGWAVAGALIGACPGVAASSRVKIRHGVIGGLVGGFAGGWLFEALATSSSSGSRLVALISLGIAIGAVVRLVEQVRKQAWLVLMVGGPEGKEFILSKGTTTLGSHYQDDVCVAGDRGYPLREAVIVEDGNRHFLETVPGGKAFVDGEPVVRRTALRSGSTIRFGASELVFQLRAATGEVPPPQPKRTAPVARPAAPLHYEIGSSRKAAAPVIQEEPAGVDWIEEEDAEPGIELGEVGHGPARKMPPRRNQR